MASCTNCGNRNLARVPGERNTCIACNNLIYEWEGSALTCRQCDSHFHEFCLQNTAPINFMFADNPQRVTLALVSVNIGRNRPVCEACGDPMSGSSRYTTPNRDISVHPSCAVNFVPTRNGNNQVPEQLRNFLNGRRNDFDNMVINLYRVGPRDVGNCLLCDRGPGNTHVTAEWWYVMTRNGQLGGCHVGCLKTQIAINRSNNRIVDLETYYDSINGGGNVSRIETAQAVLELVIGVTLTPPISNVLIFGLKVMAAAVIRRNR